MKIAILNTGNELLRGATVNTNLSFIGRALTALGKEPDCGVTVPDSPEDIRTALETLFATHDLVIVTGGLGPTSDDLTREAVCELLGEPLREDLVIRRTLEEYWHERRPDCAGPDFYFRQALIPVNGAVLKNRNGTAPGLWIPGVYHGRKVFAALLPGPPLELEPMVRDELLPLLRELRGETVCTDKFMLADTPELSAQNFIETMLSATLKVSYSASPEGTRIFVSGHDADEVHAAAGRIKAHFGHAVINAPHLSVAEDVLELLAATHGKLATAESCTGGLIGAALTDCPGASAVYEGGIISYSNAIKIHELGIPRELLERHGAVSSECVRAMIDGVCRKFNTEAGIAATGIAGPTGGTTDKPVGLVYIAAGFNGRTEVRQLRLRGDRDQIRRRTVAKALNLLRELLISR